MRDRLSNLVLGMLISALVFGSLGSVLQTATSAYGSACAESTGSGCCSTDQVGEVVEVADPAPSAGCCCEPGAVETETDETGDEGEKQHSDGGCDQCFVFCCLGGHTVLLLDVGLLAEASVRLGEVWIFERSGSTVTIAPESPPPNRVSV